MLKCLDMNGSVNRRQLNLNRRLKSDTSMKYAYEITFSDQSTIQEAEEDSEISSIKYKGEKKMQDHWQPPGAEIRPCLALKTSFEEGCQC